MPRFFIEPAAARVGDTVTLTGEDYRHIAFSLRARIGESLTLCDADKKEYQTVIRLITDKEVTLEVLDIKTSGTEPDVEVTLYQALTKSDKFDAIVQKAVELGVGKIVPVLSKRCVSRPDSASLEKKTERWQKIAKAAAMQCGRACVPVVETVKDIAQALEEIASADCGFVCYENSPQQTLSDVFHRANQEKKAVTYAFFVGPEGGIDEKEAQLALQMNIPLAGLGKRILRTETAPVCVLSAIMFYTNNLN